VRQSRKQLEARLAEAVVARAAAETNRYQMSLLWAWAKDDVAALQAALVRAHERIKELEGR